LVVRRDGDGTKEMPLDLCRPLYANEAENWSSRHLHSSQEALVYVFHFETRTLAWVRLGRVFLTGMTTTIYPAADYPV
jgi:hypothetical protein